MALTYATSTEGVDWNRVAEILESFGLSHDDGETQKLIFEASYAVVFVYDGDLLVGCGRALSDGLRQAALYNIALDKDYDGHKAGRGIVEALKEQVQGCTVILYTHPQTVAFYEKLGFRRQKTGMVILNKGEDAERWMEGEGFLLPKGYRFGGRSPYERIAVAEEA